MISYTIRRHLSIILSLLTIYLCILGCFSWLKWFYDIFKSFFSGAIDESILNSTISIETKVNRVEISFEGLESRLETLLPSSKRTISKRPGIFIYLNFKLNYSYSAARYRPCRLISHSFVNHDTVVFRVILQEKSNFSIPIGHHVSIKIRKGGEIYIVRSCYITSWSLAATLYRPYTPIRCNYDEETYTTSIDFMIKVYDDGICSPFFRQLKTGSHLYSCYKRDWYNCRRYNRN